MMSDKVIVFGANGLLGSTLCTQLTRLGWHVLRQSRKKGADLLCDTSNADSVRDVLRKVRPSAIINLIAISNVDYCESHVAEAYLANVRTVEFFVSLIREMDTPPHLVQISTDHLYGGTGPHSEGSVMPMNVYALTKLAGELVALQANATVLRTNFFGRSNTGERISFTDWLYNSLISGQSFTVFDDVLFSGLNMETLADFISKVIQSPRSGVFNVGSHNGLSKAKFSVIFAEHLGLDISAMKVGSLRDVQLTASRPHDMRMDISAFEAEFGLRMPDMAEQIFDAAERYRSKTC